MFFDVKVLIWDFDGTLYKPNADLFHEVRESEYRTIMEYTHWDREKTIEKFEKYYKKITPSATQTVAKLCGISTSEAALYMEKYYDRRTFLLRDEKLIDLFKKLKKYTHYILANGVRHRIEETLEALGVPKTTFTDIVTSEVSGENKPSEKGFVHILNKTGLPPAAHLMIGDRELVDIAPAKALGMHTCLVWSGEESRLADVTLPTVYGVPAALL
jgi:HAD superfamily hydrolase (TIGR01549 family)